LSLVLPNTRRAAAALSALIVCARGSIRKAASFYHASCRPSRPNKPLRPQHLSSLRHTHNVTYCLPAAIILCRYIILKRNIPSAAGGGGEGVRLTSNLYSIRLAGRCTRAPLLLASDISLAAAETSLRRLLLGGRVPMPSRAEHRSRRQVHLESRPAPLHYAVCRCAALECYASVGFSFANSFRVFNGVAQTHTLCVGSGVECVSVHVCVCALVLCTCLGLQFNGRGEVSLVSFA
jgi:hypothetical protein